MGFLAEKVPQCPETKMEVNQVLHEFDKQFLT
jgi:hypothetical protein